MGENCGDCSKWGQDMYWTHFQSTMFFKPLPQGFDQQLAIPEKFAKNMKNKVPENVTVTGPSGEKWNIGLVSNGETLFFKDGWRKFVGDNFLKEDDVLIFKYNGVSSFDVLVFDGQNLCERESSYFTRKCGHAELDGGVRTKRNLRERKMKESPVNSGHDSSDSGGDCSLSKKPRTRVGVRKVNSVAEEGSEEGSVGRCLLHYVSNRRPVTRGEIKNALHMARAAWYPGSCIVVMRPSHVYRGFFLSLPFDWVRTQLPPKSDDVTLLLKEEKKVWHAKYSGRVRAACGLSGGWKDFAFDNNLEEFDVCLFKLVNEMHDGIVMDVGIFRVVAEVSPLTRAPLGG